MAKVTIYVTKKTLLRRKGQPDLQLMPGPQTVDEDVANHWLVKAHSEKMSEGQAVVDAQAVAKIAELEMRLKNAQNAGDEALAGLVEAEEKAALAAQRADAAEAKVAELTTLLEAYEATAGDKDVPQPTAPAGKKK